MKTLHYCPKCGRQLIKSNSKGYAFQCIECDEDFYSLEVINNNMKSDEVKLIYPTKVKPSERPI